MSPNRFLPQGRPSGSYSDTKRVPVGGELLSARDIAFWADVFDTRSLQYRDADEVRLWAEGADILRDIAAWVSDRKGSIHQSGKADQ